MTASRMIKTKVGEEITSKLKSGLTRNQDQGGTASKADGIKASQNYWNTIMSKSV